MSLKSGRNNNNSKGRTERPSEVSEKKERKGEKEGKVGGRSLSFWLSHSAFKWPAGGNEKEEKEALIPSFLLPLHRNDNNKCSSYIDTRSREKKNFPLRRYRSDKRNIGKFRSFIVSNINTTYEAHSKGLSFL